MQAKKALGQNFLNNDTIIIKIVSLFNCENNDLILEIGPGRGALSKYLQDKGRLICIEIDKDMAPFLDKINASIIYDDILQANLSNILSNYTYDNLYVIGNLPYYITSPIIEKVILSNINAQKMVFMVQKEVAERLAEHPGGKNTGSITYSIHYYTNPEIVLDVPKESFIPSPKVDSSVIKLDVLENPKIKVINEEVFFKVVKCAFMQKRKTLINSLSNSGISSKEELENILNELNLDLRVRAEQLTLEQFGFLSDKLSI